MSNKIAPELDALFEVLLGEEKQLVYQQIGQKLPHTFRFNPLKGSITAQQALFGEQGFGFQPLEGRENIFLITYQPYPIGKSLSHFLGHIYVQDIASMIPALVLNPRPGERVLDMSAAPGSKTTLMGSLMENRGILIANDVVPKRLKALGNNIDRWSLANTTVYKWRGEQFGNAYFEQFDRILLDPGCSGLGTLHKNPEVLGWWSTDQCQRLAAAQRSLIISAIKSLRPGGVLVYSTCTLSTVENEEVIDFALQRFPVKVEEIRLPEIRTWPGLTGYRGRTFHADLSRTVRLYPVDRLTEGFYIARLRKTASMKPPNPKKRQPPRQVSFLSHKTSPVKKYLDYLSDHFQIPRSTFEAYVYTMRTNISALPREAAEFQFYGKPLQGGLQIAAPMDRGAKLKTAGVHLFGPYAKENVLELPDLETLEKFVNRNPLEIPVDGKGQVIVKYRGCVIGYGVSDKGRLKSQFPKAEWPFQLLGEWPVVNQQED